MAANPFSDLDSKGSDSKGSAPKPRKGKRTPWVLLGIVAVVAIGATVATVLLWKPLDPDSPDYFTSRYGKPDSIESVKGIGSGVDVMTMTFGKANLNIGFGKKTGEAKWKMVGIHDIPTMRKLDDKEAEARLKLIR